MSGRWGIAINRLFGTKEWSAGEFRGRLDGKTRQWATSAANKPLEPFAYDPGALGHDDVEIAVDTCGICHSDASVMNNEWAFRPILSFQVTRSLDV